MPPKRTTRTTTGRTPCATSSIAIAAAGTHDSRSSGSEVDPGCEERVAHDMIVIGGGAAGLVTSAGAAGLGARVALIERDRLGGECLWTGCVPSKALIACARAAHEARTASRFGIATGPVTVNFAEVMAWVRDAQRRIAPNDSPERFRSLGVDVVAGTARFTGERTLQVDGKEMRAKRIVGATGSRPAVSPIEGLAGLLLERLCAEGVDIVLDAKVRRASRQEGVIRLDASRSDGSALIADGDALLLATGRSANVGLLDADRAGIATGPDGIVTNDRLRTTADGVWAAGDVTGGLRFTHVADYEARLVLRNAFFPYSSGADYSTVPWVTFTDPELAHVGLTEREARDRLGDGMRVWRKAFGESDRAITDGHASGLVKLIADRRGRLVGGHVLGHGAGSVIGEIAVALKHRISVSRLGSTIHAYPTYPEAIRQAAEGHVKSRFRGPIRTVTRWLVRR